MSEIRTFEIWVNGQKMASVSGPSDAAIQEAAYYQWQYVDEGYPKVFEKIGKKRVEVLLVSEPLDPTSWSVKP